MKEFNRDVLWINYDYVIINDDLEKCYLKISNLIDAEINNGPKDYDKEYIRKHIEKFLNFSYSLVKYKNVSMINFEGLDLNLNLVYLISSKFGKVV